MTIATSFTYDYANTRDAIALLEYKGYPATLEKGADGFLCINFEHSEDEIYLRLRFSDIESFSKWLQSEFLKFKELRKII